MEYKKIYKNLIESNIDDEIIQNVETEINRKLPESFKKMLKVQNGGEVIDYEDDDNECWLDYILGIGEGAEFRIENEYFAIDEYEEFNVVPFGLTPSGGHDYFSFDYNNLNENNEPTVVLVDTEGDISIKKITDSFDKFIQMVINHKDLTDGEYINTFKNNIDNEENNTKKDKYTLADISGIIVVLSLFFALPVSFLLMLRVSKIPFFVVLVITVISFIINMIEEKNRKNK